MRSKSGTRGRAAGTRVRGRRNNPAGFAGCAGLAALAGLTVLSIMTVSCAAEPAVLRVGLFAGSPWGVPTGDSYRFMDSAIADYEASHPGVRIVYRPGTLKEDYSEWLARGLVKGNEPDLYAVLPGDFTTFASIGAMEDLDAWMDGSADFSRADFYGTALSSGQFRGRQLALPLEVAPNLMFVNTSLLKDAGIPEPKEGWTWDDFYRICEAVTTDRNGDGEIDRFGTGRLSWRSFAITNSADPWDATGGSATTFGSADFAQTIQFISRVEKLNRHHEVPSFDSGKVAFSSELWSSFRAYSSYPYRVNRFSQFQWVALPMPRGPHGRGASELQSSLMAVSRHSPQKALAWDFLKFLTANLKTQENLVRYSYGWPALKAASRTGLLESILKKGEQASVSVPSVIDSIIANSVVTPRFHKFEAVMTIADRELYRMVDDPYNLQDRLLALDKSLRETLR